MRETRRATYEHAPDQLPESEIGASTVRSLFPGNPGQLLHAHRTPIVIVGVMPKVDMFELEVTAFEDAGARGWIPTRRPLRCG